MWLLCGLISTIDYPTGTDSGRDILVFVQPHRVLLGAFLPKTSVPKKRSTSNSKQEKFVDEYL